MKKHITISLFVVSLFIFIQCKKSTGIPIEDLKIELADNTQTATTTILKNEIKGIHVDHIAVTSKKAIEDTFNNDYKTIFLFVKGKGNVIAADSTYEIVFPYNEFCANNTDVFVI